MMSLRRWIALALFAIGLVGAVTLARAQELQPCECPTQRHAPVVKGHGYVLVIEERTAADGTTQRDAVLYPSEPCDWDYIRNSYFLSLIYGCSDGGSSGAR